MSPRGVRRDRARTRNREARRRRRLGIAAGAALGATALSAPAADAATFNVTNLNDADEGSLRQAILDANDSSGTDDITFQSGLTGQITLSTGELYISDAVYIHGPGADVLAVSGQDASRVINIDLGAPADRGTVKDSNYVTVAGLTVTDGKVTDQDGAGIKNVGVDLAVLDSVVSSNRVLDTGSDVFGAGIAAIGRGASLTVENSTISGNRIEAQACDDEEVERLVIICPPGDARGDEEDLGGAGGGIATNQDVDAFIENSTISGNAAEFGGGIFATNNLGNTIGITRSTIADNDAEISGGGIYRKYEGEGETNLLGTIVGGNSAPDGPDLGEDETPTQRFNVAFSLIGNTADVEIVETGPNLLNQDPQLGDLGDNGGPTETHLPAGTSPALDQGLADGPGDSDQRGLARTADDPAIDNAADGTDIGSVERELSGIVEPPATGGPAGTVAATRTCLGQTATIVGTTGKDVIIGTEGRDVIRGLRGNDVIKSLGGDDIVCGDKGTDKIRTGEGDDSARGGTNGDRIRGGGGGDILRGGSGQDNIRGEDGDDQLFGGAPRGKTAKGPSGRGGPDNVCDGGAGTDSAAGCETERNIP